MNRILLLIMWACLNYAYVSAQILTASQPILSFGSVNELAPDSMQVFIKNNDNVMVQVTDAVLLQDPYNHQVWSISNNNFSITPGDSVGVWVKFQPIHNIFHNAELLFLNDAKRGPVRIDLQAQGSYSKPYYNTTTNKSQESLKTTLKTLLGTSYVDLGYNGARDAMYMTIDNQKVNGQGASVNTVECVYTGRLATNYANRQEAQAQNFNTEHTFPQSLFSSNQPMLSDLFHIFPSDEVANNVRGNLPFGTVSSGATWSVGGSKGNGTIFEPRDYHKGKAARALLYFAIRYQDYSCFVKGQEASLRQWHSLYPPDAVEQSRNNAISAVQNNRNPFVDYPQFIERISAVTTCQTATETPLVSVLFPETLIDYADLEIDTDNTYHYQIVNDGTDTLQIFNLNLNTPNFNFTNGTGVNTSILPGESLPISITANLPAIGLASDTLSLQTNVSTTSVKIPIIANGINSVAITPSLLTTSNIYPNPVTEGILTVSYPLWSGKELTMGIYASDGKILRRETLDFTGKKEWNVQALPAGIYHILVTNTQSGECVSGGFIVR